MKGIFWLRFRNGVTPHEIHHERFGLDGRIQDHHFSDNFHALSRSFLVARRTFTSHNFRYEQRKSVERRLPLFLSGNLVRKHDHVPLWPSGEEADDRRFDVDTWFQGFSFSRFLKVRMSATHSTPAASEPTPPETPVDRSR
jgi:hypothetical protein